MHFSFGPFTVDSDLRELRRHGHLLPLQDKPFQLLTLLLEKPGEIITRDAIRQSLWGKDTFVEFDDNLNQAVRKLRNALDDSADVQRYLKTIPRRGYRFLASVSIDNPDSSPATSASAVVPLTAAASSLTNPTRRLSAALILLSVFALAGGWRAGSWKWTDARQEAAQAYQRGQHLSRERRLSSARAAVEEFRRAIELQPHFARAYAGLAEASSMIHPRDATTSVQLAEQAVQLDPNCGECYGVLGYLRFSKQWRFGDAETSLRRAIALAPDDSQLQYWHAQLQAILGRPAAALKLIDAHLGRVPQAWNLHVLKSACLYFQKDFAGAIREADKAVAVDLVPAWDWRSRALFLKGEYAEAVFALTWSLGAWSERSADTIGARTQHMKKLLAEQGLPGPLEYWLNETAPNGPAAIHAFNRAIWQMLLTRPDAALDELERGLAGQSFDMVYVGVDPIFESLHGNPRFQRVLEGVGLAPVPSR